MGYTVMTVMIRSIPGPEQVWLVWKISTIDFMCPGELRRVDVQRLSLSHANGCQTTLFATILTSLSSSLSLFLRNLAFSLSDLPSRCAFHSFEYLLVDLERFICGEHNH